VLVLPQAVPAELWEPASALVHHYLGQPGAITDGGFDCMGALVAKWCKIFGQQELVQKRQTWT